MTVTTHTLAVVIEKINVEDIYAFVVLIISSIHLHLSFSGSWGVAGAYPSCLRPRGRAHPGQSVAGLTHRQRKLFTLT